MLAKCIDEDQTNWSVKLPYVLMAYRSSVHESTGFTPHYLVFGHEISLPLDLMYRPPQSTTPIDVYDWVSQKEEAFRQAYELVRRNATTQQRRRNHLYNKRVHGPKYKEGEHILLHYPVVQPGKSPKLSSPWRGPYEILKCLNDVNYKIKELTTGKVQVVHYDRMKRYHGPIPVASNVQTRKTTHTPVYQTPPVSDFDHSQCGQTFIPYHFVPQVTSPHPVNRPTSPIQSPNPIADNFPNRSPSVIRLLFFHPRADVVYLHRQGLLTTNAIPHHPFPWSPVPVQLLKTFSLPAHLLRNQLLFSLLHGLILSSMVLLTIFVSDSIVHHSRTVLQHYAPL